MAIDASTLCLARSFDSGEYACAQDSLGAWQIVELVFPSKPV